jgi:hypothetical protein
MPTISESIGSQLQLAGSLAAGVKTISQDQAVVFTMYIRVVLPLDGFVFWVRSDLVSAAVRAAAVSGIPTPLYQVSVQGSLHYATQNEQREDETADINRVVFTSLSQIDEFNVIGPGVMFLGEFEGIRFAFNRRDSFYQQANLYHYVGDAVYPALDSQIIDAVGELDTTELIVSNSLPVWLTLNQFMPMYPSFLVPGNIAPPYAVVHIDPSSTNAIQSAPALDSTLSHYQLVSDRVRITMYGLGNNQAMDFQDYVFQYSLNTDVIGVMNMPVIRDEKRTQSELSVIAMKKSIEIEVSYYQARVNTIARQFIKSAIPTYMVAPDPY